MKETSTTIALLTDFGLSDQYVGVMKGVILNRVPNANIVDISHNVSPHNIDEGAYLLWASYQYFPPGTIFVSVVDPGVGSKRKVICVVGDGYYFLAPDNGLLKYVLSALGNFKTYSVTERKYFLAQVSNTFHGRDIFAPVCAHLANGLAPSRLGNTIKPETTPGRFITIDPLKKQLVKGRIIHIDRFGNLVTNFQPVRINAGFEKMKIEVNSIEETKHKENFVTHYSLTYAEAPEHKPFMIIGSSGLMEVSLKNGSAADFLKAVQGTSLTLRTKYA